MSIITNTWYPGMSASIAASHWVCMDVNRNPSRIVTMILAGWHSTFFRTVLADEPGLLTTFEILHKLVEHARVQGWPLTAESALIHKYAPLITPVVQQWITDNPYPRPSLPVQTTSPVIPTIKIEDEDYDGEPDSIASSTPELIMDTTADSSRTPTPEPEEGSWMIVNHRSRDPRVRSVCTWSPSESCKQHEQPSEPIVIHSREITPIDPYGPIPPNRTKNTQRATPTCSLCKQVRHLVYDYNEYQCRWCFEYNVKHKPNECEERGEWLKEIPWKLIAVIYEKILTEWNGQAIPTHPHNRKALRDSIRRIFFNRIFHSSLPNPTGIFSSESRI
jgi:hypothetical protein